MTLKSSLLALSIAALANTAFAGGYAVEQWSADETYWTVSYFDDLTANEGSFSVVYDADNAEVTFSFTSADGMFTESCIVDETSPSVIFEKSVTLANNVNRVDSFTVYPPVVGDVCAIVDDIEYRDDVADVEFNCEEGYTQWGQSVYVVGSTPLLGNWNPANAIRLEPIYYPHWQGRITVEAETDIEWKCIVRDEVDSANVLMWEQGDNNSFNSGDILYQWGRFIFH